MLGGSAVISNGVAFDQDSGLFLELSFSDINSAPGWRRQTGYAMGMIDNNIWLSSDPPDFLNLPGFSVSNGGPMSFQTGSLGSSSITLTGKNGFGATVTLQVSSPTGLSCSLSKTSIQGQGSTTLTCTRQSGSYTVAVTATSGRTSHSTHVGVQVSSLPTSTQTSKTTTTAVSSILSLAIILAALGIVAVAAVLAVFLLLRRRSNKPANVPSVPPPFQTP